MSALEEADILRFHKDARLLPKAEEMMQRSERMLSANNGPLANQKSADRTTCIMLPNVALISHARSNSAQHLSFFELALLPI